MSNFVASGTPPALINSSRSVYQHPRSSRVPSSQPRQVQFDLMWSDCSVAGPTCFESLSMGLAIVGGPPPFPLAHRIHYVYLHIDTESLTNEELPCPHPSIFLGNFPSFACHSRFVILANGISDERVCELSA
jgi:hypothetical protein